MPLPPSTNKTHTDLDPDLTGIGFGAVPPDPTGDATSAKVLSFDCMSFLIFDNITEQGTANNMSNHRRFEE